MLLLAVSAVGVGYLLLSDDGIAGLAWPGSNVRTQRAPQGAGAGSLAPGQPCNSNQICLSGICDANTLVCANTDGTVPGSNLAQCLSNTDCPDYAWCDLSTGACMSKVVQGSDCYLDDMCETGYCEPSTYTCSVAGTIQGTGSSPAVPLNPEVLVNLAKKSPEIIKKIASETPEVISKVIAASPDVANKIAEVSPEVIKDIAEVSPEIAKSIVSTGSGLTRSLLSQGVVGDLGGALAADAIGLGSGLTLDAIDFGSDITSAGLGTGIDLAGKSLGTGFDVAGSTFDVGGKFATGDFAGALSSTGDILTSSADLTTDVATGIASVSTEVADRARKEAEEKARQAAELAKGLVGAIGDSGAADAVREVVSWF